MKSINPEKPLFVPLLDNGNGSVMASFMMDHGAAFTGRQVHMIRASDSHANRGMNHIANAFLESDCDIWINIDADIRFRKMDIDLLLSHNLPLVYGIYPKKDEAANPCLATFDEVMNPDANGLTEVRRCGRGFMLVRRELLEAMKEDNGGPALRYHNHGKIEWDFFPSGVVTGPFSVSDARKIDKDGFPLREWISEDWFFCERARALGIKILVDSRIALGHIGQKEYRFGPDQLARFDSNISSWRDIHGWFDYEDLYRELAAKIPDRGKFVEVGVWLGRSIAAFHEFARKLGKTHIEIHAVDTFCGVPANETQRAILAELKGNTQSLFEANMRALDVDLTVHAIPSADAAARFEDESIDAIFIDADHSEKAVTQDIEAWLPKVKLGGILCGHDIDEAGVAGALAKSGLDFTTVGRCWKVTKRSAGQILDGTCYAHASR